MSDRPLMIDKNFIVLSPEKKATIEDSDAALFERLVRNYGDFRNHELISCYEFDADWQTWEVHPFGDEIVILLSGRATFVIRDDSGESESVLEKDGQYVVVPKGAWHTAKIDNYAKVLFITPGQGTQIKETEGDG